MTLFVFFTYSLFLSVAQAASCTDFSGNYASDDGIKVKINQSYCSNARFEYNDGIENRAVNYVFDGSRIKILEIPGVIVNYESAMIQNSDYILIFGENVFPDGYSNQYTRRILFNTDMDSSKKFLLDEIGSFDPGGAFHIQIKMIYKRV